MALYGEYVVYDGVLYRVQWTGEADRQELCFSLVKPRSQRVDPRWHIPRETLEGQPYKPRGRQVARGEGTQS